MRFGLNASVQALLALQSRHDITAHNLANVDTIGYRRQVVGFSAFSQVMNDATTPDAALLDEKLDIVLPDEKPDAVVPDEKPAAVLPFVKPPVRPAAFQLQLHSMVDTHDGHTRSTGNRSDLALSGDAYFTLQLPDGDAYTRNGAFRLDSDQRLVSADGYPLMGERGAITITSPNWEVTTTGQVLMNGKVVDRLKLVTFSPATAQAMGSTLWRAAAVTQAGQVQVSQGALEGSNVSAITEMIDLVAITRLFEANQRCLQAQDALLERAVNDIGRA